MLYLYLRGFEHLTESRWTDASRDHNHISSWAESSNMAKWQTHGVLPYKMQSASESCSQWSSPIEQYSGLRNRHGLCGELVDGILVWGKP